MSYKKKNFFYCYKYPLASKPLRRKPDDLKLASPPYLPNICAQMHLMPLLGT